MVNLIIKLETSWLVEKVIDKLKLIEEIEVFFSLRDIDKPSQWGLIYSYINF